MKTAHVAIFLSLILLAAPAGAGAAPDDQTAQSLEGTVLSSGNISFAIRTDDGDVRTFLITTSTQMPAGGLSAGDRVTIRSAPVSDERTEALSVAVTERAGSEVTTPSAGALGAQPTEEEEGISGPAFFALAIAVVLLIAVGIAAAAGVGPRHGAPRHTA
jgi:type IV secretory pathway VirB2 component (pilin)